MLFPDFSIRAVISKAVIAGASGMPIQTALPQCILMLTGKHSSDVPDV